MNARPKIFLWGYIFVLSIKDGPIKCLKVCGKKCDHTIVKSLTKQYLNLERNSKISPLSSLHDMIEAGLNRIVEQLEEIGSAAGKEFSLETAMEKMKEEWSSICFECVPYRESGVSILSGIEDIQQMLDDHILKGQSMSLYSNFTSILS